MRKPHSSDGFECGFFIFFAYICDRESATYYIGINLIGVGRHRHFCAATAHNPTVAIGCGSLLPLFAQIVRLVAQPPSIGNIYSQFPRTSRYPATR